MNKIVFAIVVYATFVSLAYADDGLHDVVSTELDILIVQRNKQSEQEQYWRRQEEYYCTQRDYNEQQALRHKRKYKKYERRYRLTAMYQGYASRVRTKHRYRAAYERHKSQYEEFRLQADRTEGKCERARRKKDYYKAVKHDLQNRINNLRADPGEKEMQRR